MLRLERVPKDRVSIRITERTATYDRRFWRSVVYSTVFHLLIFGTIRIEYLKVHEYAAPPVPIEVAVDHEPTADVSVLDSISEADEPTTYGMEDIKLSYPSRPFVKQELPSDAADTFTKNIILPEPISQPTFYTTALPYIPKNNFRERIYPLRIQLSSELRSLKLIADGSSLFREKTPSDVVAKLRLSPTPLSIDYKVHVSGKTGKVIQWSRIHVLLDKSLQELADRIVYSLRFGTTRNTTTKGIIRVTFECSGSKIGDYLLNEGGDAAPDQGESYD